MGFRRETLRALGIVFAGVKTHIHDIVVFVAQMRHCGHSARYLFS